MKPSRADRRRLAAPTLGRLAVVLIIAVATLAVVVGPAAAQGDVTTPTVPEPGVEVPSVPPAGEPLDDETDTGTGITIDIGGNDEEPSQTVLLIVGLSLLSLAPSLVIMLTSFTRIVVLLSMTATPSASRACPRTRW